MKYCLLIALCFLSVISLQGQSDTLNVDGLLKKALFFNQKNQDSAIYYSKKAYSLAELGGNQTEIASTAYFFSFYLIADNQFEVANEIIDTQLNTAESISYITVGNLLFNRATISYLKEEYDKALLDFLLSSNYYEESHSTRNAARSYLQISVIYQKIDHQELSDYFGELSLKNMKGSKNHIKKLNESKSANELEEFLKISPIEPKLKSILHYNLGKKYLENKDYKKSASHLMTSIKSKEKYGYSNLLVETKVTLAEVLFRENKHEASLKILQQLTPREKRKQLLRIEHLLTENFKKEGNFEEALFHNERLGYLQDSINRIDENVRIAEISAQYDTEKKQSQILQLQKENEATMSLLSKQKRTRIFTSLAAILFLLTALFSIRRWKTSSKREKEATTETEQIKKKVEAQHLLLKNKSKIYLEELQFIKSEGNYVEFHSIEQRTLDRNKLKAILSQLPPNFVRVHRSYIVNKNEISSFTSTTIFLKSGVEIPLSRTFKSNI